MRIPQYEQRIIASPAKRTQANIKEPETFRDTSSLNRVTKKMGQTAELAGDVYLDMKKQRDQGIVDEFTNQYNVAKIEKVNELRNQYKGANSTQIVDEFSKWHNDYLATHLGIGQEAGKDTLILENDAQIEGAKKALDDDLPTSINSLSSYAATELNNYRNNQFEGVIYGLSDRLSKEQDIDNIFALESTIRYKMNTHYAGESQEYIDMQSKKITSKSLATNIRNSMATDPELSMMKILNPVFADRLTGDDTNALEKEAVAAFKEKQSVIVAEQGLNGFDIAHGLNEESFAAIKPVLDRQGGADVILAQIKESANTKKQSMALAKRQSEAFGLNESTTNILNSLEVISGADYTEDQRATAKNNLNALFGNLNRGGADAKYLANLINTTSDEVNAFGKLKSDLAMYRTSGQMYKDDAARDEYMAISSELQKQKDHIKADSVRVGEMMAAIDRGEYSDYRSFDFEGLHGVSKFEVLNAIRSNQKYKRAEQLAKANGYNLSKETATAFKSVSKADASDSPLLYGEFNKAFKDLSLEYYKRNKTFPTDVAEISRIANQAYNNMLSEDPVVNAIMDTAQTAIKEKADLAKGEKYVSLSDLIEEVADEMDDDVFDELSDDEKKEVAKLILNGNMYAAKTYIKGGSQ